VVSHFSDLASNTSTTGQLIKQEQHTAIPIIGGMKIPAAPAELAGSDKFSDIVEMAQTTEVRAPDLLDEFFDFGDLLMPQGRMTKPHTTPSSCHDLSAQHKHPFCPRAQGLPVGLPDDSYDIMDFSKLEQLFEPHKVAQGHGPHSSIPQGVFSSFSKVAANERMRLRDALRPNALQSHAVIQKQDLPLNGCWVDSAGGDGTRANDAETHSDATDGTDSGGCSATTTPTVEQPTIYMTSIAVHDPAPNAELYSAKRGLDPFEFNEQCIESYSAASNFGTGNASGVELAVCHMKVSPQSHLLYASHLLYDTLVCERSMWYGVFIIIQVHAWYFWYSNNVAAQPHKQIHELWVGDDALNSALVDVSWIGQQPGLCKLLLCCVCLFGSWYVKQTDGELPQFQKLMRTGELTANDWERWQSLTTDDWEQRQSARSEEFVSEAQRLKWLYKMMFLLLRTFCWTLVLYEIVVQMLKFNQDNHFGKDVFNIVRAASFAIYITVLSPSTVYWTVGLLRWVSIWTVIPIQISVYLAFGSQYVTLCCQLNLAAWACTVNIAKMHIIGMFHEWSAAKQAQELLWILAWFVLAFDLEMAPRLIAMTAASCAAVWAKVWVARWYSRSSI